MNILAVGAHPDDLELGCFGTLGLHKEKGDKIFGAIISNGALSSKPEKRMSETVEAAKLIDMKMFFGDFIDGSIVDNSELVTFLDKIIEKNKISIVYTHTIHDRHQDHKMVANASLSAARNIDELYSYESPSVIYPFNPHVFVDVTKTFQVKIDAIKKHVSQQDKIYMRLEAIQGLAKFRAYQCGLTNRLCESFEVQRIVRK